MRSASALLIPLLLFGKTGLAVGAPETTAVTARLEVRASRDCTSQADLVARVLARSPRIRFVQDGAAVVVSAQFTSQRSGHVVGELVLTGPGARASSRRLLARSCGDAADAVALIIAVTIAPTAASDRQAAASSPVAAGEEAAAATPTEASPGVSNEATSSQKPVSKPSAGASRSPPSSAEPARAPAQPAAQATAPVAARTAEDSSSAATVEPRLRFAAYVAGQAFFGPAPAVMPGIAGYAFVGLDREALWSPAIVLGATHAWTPELVEWGGTALFTLDAASLDACAVRLRLPHVEARGCGSALVGGLSARGRNTLNAPDPITRPFGTLGASAVLTTRAGSLVELAARVTFGMNLVRDSFAFSPRVFHTVDAVTVSASLGVGLRAP